MKIKLRKAYYNSEFIIETSKDEGYISIKGTEIPTDSIGYIYYDVTLSTDKMVYQIGDIGYLPSNTNLGEFFLSQLLNQGIKASLTSIDRLNYKIKFNCFTEEETRLLNKLKTLPDTDVNLDFKQFKSITNNAIVVEYYGHEVGGSYMHDYEIAPSYVEVLESVSNKKVKWEGRETGPIGVDIYTFIVFINKEKKEE